MKQHLGLTGPEVEVVLLTHPGPWVAGVLAVACTSVLYLVTRTGYLVASTLITAYVVFLLSMDGLALGRPG